MIQDNNGSTELIIKVGLLSQFNNMHKQIFQQEGPDQSAIKKYIIHKPYFIEKRKERFFVTGNDNNVKNAKKTQLWAIVLNVEKLPEELKDYFKSVQENQIETYAISN